MRRILLAIPIFLSAPAFAQSQAANPVEPFSYGLRVGTAKNPLYAALSSVVPSAQAGPTQAAAPVEMFSYGRRVGTQSNPIYVNLGTALSGYAKTSDLQNYLPLTGGTMTGNVQMQGHLVMNGGNYISFSTNGHLQYFDNTDSLLMEISAGDGNPAAVKVYTPLFNAGAPTSNPGSGSHYVCVDDAGEMFRSDTACVQ